MGDLSIVFYTANFLHEPFAGKVRQFLLDAAWRRPIICVSQKPMDFGENICVGDIGRSHLNLYRQILIGCKAAKTKYVGMAEDDMIYTADHFNTYRPSPGKFAYNMNKWSIFTWTKPPIFSYRNRMVVNSLIAERDMLVAALEERYAKFAGIDDSQVPIKYWGDPGRYEKYLGVTERPTEEWWSGNPNVVFSHPEAFGFVSRGERKKLGGPKAYEIPYWGRAEEVLKMYFERIDNARERE